MIDFENGDSRAAHWRRARDDATGFNKMLIPAITPRMEERNKGVRCVVDSREVRAFVRVAEMAGEGQVFERIAAVVLARDDVFDMESQAHSAAFVRSAILAPKRGAPTHRFARCCVHHAASCPRR